MVDEEKPDGEIKEPVKKAAGRPAKKPTSKPVPDPEPIGAAEEQPEDAASEDGEKESASQEEYLGAPAGRIIPEGEEVKIETREEHGTEVAAETVYRAKKFPNSSRTTYLLVATEGTRIQ